MKIDFISLSDRTIVSSVSFQKTLKNKQNYTQIICDQLITILSPPFLPLNRNVSQILKTIDSPLEHGFFSKLAGIEQKIFLKNFTPHHLQKSFCSMKSNFHFYYLNLTSKEQSKSSHAFRSSKN
jgi:hypothetical protein